MELLAIIKKPTYIHSDSIPQLKNASEIYVIAILKKFQGLGIGSCLIRYSEKFASNVFVKTSSEDAVKFYIKNGFNFIDKEIRGNKNLSIFHKTV